MQFDYDQYGDYQYFAVKNGHPIQRYWHKKRVEAALRAVEAHSEYRVLDIGCGSGLLSFAFAMRTNHLFGIDVSKNATLFCRNFGIRQKRSNCDFGLIGNDGKLPLKDSCVDIVLFAEVIEHLTFDVSKEILKEIIRVLRPNGILYLTTPNYASIWPLVEKALDFSGKVPRLEDQQHIQKFTPKSLVRLFNITGFDIIKITTFFFLSPFLSWLSSRMSDKLFNVEENFQIIPGCLISCTCKKQ